MRVFIVAFVSFSGELEAASIFSNGKNKKFQTGCLLMCITQVCSPMIYLSQVDSSQICASKICRTEIYLT